MMAKSHIEKNARFSWFFNILRHFTFIYMLMYEGNKKAENHVRIRTSAAIITKPLEREPQWNITVEEQVMANVTV